MRVEMINIYSEWLSEEDGEEDDDDGWEVEVLLWEIGYLKGMVNGVFIKVFWLVIGWVCVL